MDNGNQDPGSGKENGVIWVHGYHTGKGGSLGSMTRHGVWGLLVWSWAGIVGRSSWPRKAGGSWFTLLLAMHNHNWTVDLGYTAHSGTDAVGSL